MWRMTTRSLSNSSSPNPARTLGRRKIGIEIECCFFYPLSKPYLLSTYLGKQSHIHIEGFEIRKFAGADDQGGCGLATATQGVGCKGGYVIKNNRISNNMSGGRGYGGVFLDDTVDAVIEDNEILCGDYSMSAMQEKPSG